MIVTLTGHLQIAVHQHGFRSMHSTTTALHVIHDHTQRGLNEKQSNKRTVIVALNLSRAFDTVNIKILMSIILESTSKYRRVKQGVPQGVVLSPTLFNLYMSQNILFLK